MVLSDDFCLCVSPRSPRRRRYTCNRRDSNRPRMACQLAADLGRPRPEICGRAPSIDLVHYRNTPGFASPFRQHNAAEYGGWEYAAPGVQPGKWYRFAAYYRAEGVQDERPASGLAPRLGQGRTERAAPGSRTTFTQPNGPESGRGVFRWMHPLRKPAASVKLQLPTYRTRPNATIWWDDISLERSQRPGARTVRVASINLRPRDTHSAEQSVNEFLGVIRQSVFERRCDSAARRDHRGWHGKTLRRRGGIHSWSDHGAAGASCAREECVYRGRHLRARGRRDL